MSAIFANIRILAIDSMWRKSRGTARNGQFSEMMDELEMAGFVAADTGMTGSV